MTAARQPAPSVDTDQARATREPPPARRHAPTGEGLSSARQASFTVPGLTTEAATVAIEILNERLVALIDLSLTLKHVHWNVVGPSFVGVHRMIDPQVDGVRLMVDETAERIAALGGSPNGLAGHLVSKRSWNDYAIMRSSSHAHLGALDLVYTGLLCSYREALVKLGECDVISADMAIGHARQLEQYQWFIRAHLEDSAGGLANAGSQSELEAAQKVANRNRR